MTKYNHTNKGLKPHQQANTAGSDANLTAIERQDSRQVNCGENDSCNWCEIDPDCPHHAGDGENSDTSMEVNVSFGINFLDWMVIILLVVFLVNSCLPAHAVSRSTFETLLPTTNATPLQATSPYYQGIEKNRTPKRNFAFTFRNNHIGNTERTHEYGKSNFGLTIKSTPYHRIHRNALTDVKSWGYDGVLLNITLAVKPSRKPLAFFVLKNWCDPQPSQSISTKQTILLQNSTSWHTCQQSMGWQTSQNKPVGEYAGSLLTLARVTPLHPMTFHSVVNTQTTLGGQNHA